MTTTDTHSMHPRDISSAVYTAVIARGTGSFSLQDVAPAETWGTLLRGETSQLLVGGALNGALGALRDLEAVALDVEACSTVPPGGAVTVSDMERARHWLTDGLSGPANPRAEQTRVTDTLAARAWLNHPVRLTSLIVAVYAVASQAGDRARTVRSRASSPICPYERVTAGSASGRPRGGRHRSACGPVKPPRAAA